MEFWGAEVKAGKPLTVKPDFDCLIHVTQASLDKGKKGETAVLYVTVDGKKLVIGTLSQGTIPKISLELVVEKEFKLSHSLERGSVHFIGYTTPNIDEDDSSSDSEDYSEEEEDVEVAATVTANGNAGGAASYVVKADSEPKAKFAEEKKHESDVEDEGSDEKGMSVCTCFPGGWMLTRMIEMMRKMTLEMKKK